MKVKICGFDGLRGLSVLMVIMSHGVLWPKIGVTSETVTSIFSAQVGVNIFFALSGFLITHLLLQERAATGKINILSFAARRALRIFPLYFLAITLMLVLDYFSIVNVNNCSWLYA